MSAWIKIALMLLLTPFIASCAKERVVTKTETVTETVTVYRDIPAHLLIPCYKGLRPEGPVTYREIFGLWADDRAQIDICNGQLEAIKSLSQN